MWRNQNEQIEFFKGPLGQLEGAIASPMNAPKGILIIGHPDPVQEGTCDNKVVTTLSRAAVYCGWIAVRFNFHGVGQSDGPFKDTMHASEDMQAIIRHMRSAKPHLPMGLAGFSFGSYIAAHCAQQIDCAGLILIAPPVERFAFDQCVIPAHHTLVVQGLKDEVVSPQAVIDWCQQASQIHLKKFATAGHFFHGDLLTLRDCCQNFIHQTMS